VPIIAFQRRTHGEEVLHRDLLFPRIRVLDLPRPIRQKGQRNPSREAMAEIGYSVMPEDQRLGFASEAVAGLIGWAFSHPEVRLVTAETLPALGASIRVLESNGFHSLG